MLLPEQPVGSVDEVEKGTLMGMMRRRMRRRAIVGGAEAAGLAYHTGKNRGQHQAAEGYEDEPAPPYASPPPAPAVADSSPSEELGRLAQLHEQGVLTDEEFAQTKAKILA